MVLQPGAPAVELAPLIGGHPLEDGADFLLPPIAVGHQRLPARGCGGGRKDLGVQPDQRLRLDPLPILLLAALDNDRALGGRLCVFSDSDRIWKSVYQIARP